MSNPKVLDLPYLKLVEIANAINSNTIANKNRPKEEKIVTDKFIRQFGVNRKDFSETIKVKGGEIRYNPSTFLYDIDENFVEIIQAEKIEAAVEAITPTNTDKSTDAVKPRKKYYESNKVTESLPLSVEMAGIAEIINVKDELFNMLEWYQKQITKEQMEGNIVQEQLDINQFSRELQGEVVVKYLKAYKEIFERFEKLSDKYKFVKRQDMLSLALLQFCERYDKE